MTISAVAVDEILQASTHNQLIANVNSSPGRAIFTANGTWSVPDGVHKFKVYLAGGGGYGGDGVYSDGYGGYMPVGSGGNSPLISALFAGVALGTTFNIVIGARGSGSTPGGTSSFGPTMSCSGGQQGTLYEGIVGVATFPPGAPEIYHVNTLFYNPVTHPRGAGGGGPGAPGGIELWGSPGICVIEW